MSELFEQLFLPSGVLFAPLLIGLFGSLSLGIIGSYVVVRRISYAAYGISHTVLLGIGAALFFKHVYGWTWLSPLVGATIAALLSAWIIGMTTLRAAHRADSIISAVNVIGMSCGLLFLARTPGYFDPMSYLFGDILLVSLVDVAKIMALNLFIVFGGIFAYRRLQMICFDEEFARLQGIRTEYWFLFLLTLVAATVVMMMNIVGIVLSIALLTLPAMTALRFATRLAQVMQLATGLCAICTVSGLAASYHFDLPCGPCIVLIAGILYLLSFCFPVRVNE